MPLFTFVVEFKRGSYVSQTRGKTLYEAATQWSRGQGGSTILQVESLGPSAEEDLVAVVEEEPALLQGLKNVWCYSGLHEEELFVVTCIQTEE